MSSVLCHERDREDGRVIDIRNKVYHTLPRENVEVLAELELPCRVVHLNRLDDELNSDE